MNPISQILWEAAADVEVRGVRGTPYEESETCAVVAIRKAAGISRHVHINRFPPAPRQAAQIMGLAVGVRWDVIAPDFNDRYPKAVVAAAMRDAAFLASWAGPWLLGGSK